MFLLMSADQVALECVLYGDKVRNTVIENSMFTRLAYSTPDVHFNGLCIRMDIADGVISEHYSKHKCTFPSYPNSLMIRSLVSIERRILESYSLSCSSPKAMVTNLRDHLMSGMIKIFTYEKKIGTIILKISGIWEDETSYGITYKFIST